MIFIKQWQGYKTGIAALTKGVVNIYKDELLEAAQRLIRIPGYIELEKKETEVALCLKDMLTEYGLDARLMSVPGGRYNVYCTYGDGSSGRTLLLCTHLDTVPAYDMKNAFNPCVKNGRLYGRGAVDVKGILAAMGIAMKRLKTEGRKLGGKVIFLGVADEESGSAGMREAVKSGLFIADIAVIGEPSGLKPAIAHKGVMWVEIIFYGKATHGSTPKLGRNAIYYASSFIEKVKKSLIPLLDSRNHMLLGSGTINIGTINGGTRPTIVPDLCTLRFDRRLIPQESISGVLDEIRTILQELSAENDSFTYDINVLLGDIDHPFPVLDTDEKNPSVAVLKESISNVSGSDTETIGLPFWTDAALFQHVTGKPAIVLGPGNIEQAHSNDEYVEIEALLKASEIYYRMAVDYCS
jgi:acetylornithine deacetylase/succinyl-diaminopimelate desuccinylase family protein